MRVLAVLPAGRDFPGKHGAESQEGLWVRVWVPREAATAKSRETRWIFTSADLESTCLIELAHEFICVFFWASWINDDIKCRSYVLWIT